MESRGGGREEGKRREEWRERGSREKGVRDSRFHSSRMASIDHFVRAHLLRFFCSFFVAEFVS